MADVKLPADVFNVEVKNHQLLKLAYDAYLANSRMDNAKTLKRGEVRGGGKKPWRQKGTGRARFGSTRNPIWRGCGIAFGPTGEQSHKIKISKQDKRVAVCQALSLANQDKLIHVVEIKTTGKTREIAKFMDDNNVEGSALLVVNDKAKELVRATNNLPNAKLVGAMYLNVFDILNSDAIFIDKEAVKTIAEWLGTEDK